MRSRARRRPRALRTVIVRVGDREITSSEDLINAVSDLRAGDGVEIEVLRDGNRRTIRPRLSSVG